ncbi:RIP metalloprotease RseP [Natronoflexus pectinivorans]|uniref:Zinc metalloprotease n=1 Tax=Natronoflexus pectinivorans TaxID=682526 RepID=A0A4R2GJ63_9BACT|nr:RIP metalloprotease RseP [Natronoflexus pectinivorans]TCO07982.1 regulator of sigma E protease [Natronoflexus pectinivorans]
MEILIKTLQLILSLSILVILHEFGHYFFARLFKTRVEKFYLFFDPWFSLFKFKKGDTEYGIGWLPLGGYVKISGMIDESMDKEQMNQPPQPFEFRSKPAWQRLLIMVGGVLVNFLTAIVIFWMILFKWGESYIPAENAKYGFYFHPIAHEIGLQDGDRVLMADTFKINTINTIAAHILLDNVTTLTIERDGSIMTLPVPAEFKQQILADEVRVLADFNLPVIVNKLQSGSNADRAGLKPGDSIVAVNNNKTIFFNQFARELNNSKDSEAIISLYRNQELLHIPVQVTDDGEIGFFPKTPNAIFGYTQISYGFFEALPAGINKGVSTLKNYVRQFRLVFTREGARQIGGFGTIGSLFAPSWDWQNFWFMTAFLSIILAFMNILPIPALDGGHVLFLIYEIITRRKPSEKFMEYAQMTGMILLLSLLLYANGNDIYRYIFN